MQKHSSRTYGICAIWAIRGSHDLSQSHEDFALRIEPLGLMETLTTVFVRAAVVIEAINHVLMEIRAQPPNQSTGH